MSISIRRLVKVYGNGAAAVTALQGLELEVADGEVCVVRGPNGSGKSTLMGILVGDIEPTAGRVLISGEVGTGISVVRQFDNLLHNLCVEEHFRLFGDPRGLELIPLAWRRRTPAALGRGQVQMVAVALALSVQPPLLLLDEPTAALSPAEARELAAFIATAARGVGSTVLLVTHDAEAETIADHVLSLRDGRISEARSSDGRELQVMDSLGWMRMPDAVRQHLESRVFVRSTEAGAEIDGCRHTEVPPEAPPHARPVGGGMCVIVRDLTCAHGGTQVFKGIDFEVPTGAVVTVTGRSGTGKTTLLRTVAGQHGEYTGEVTMRGNGRPSYLNADAPFGMELTLKELGASPCVITAMALDDLVERPLRSLSGGQRQRALVALALSSEHDLLLLDEPTASLDDAGAALVLAAIERSPKTFLIATHDARVEAIATQRIALG